VAATFAVVNVFPLSSLSPGQSNLVPLHDILSFSLISLPMPSTFRLIWHSQPLREIIPITLKEGLLTNFDDLKDEDWMKLVLIESNVAVR
jgi:hypothetical protein